MKDGNEFKDDFLKEMLQSAGPESPSQDFMAKIMAQVDAEVIAQQKLKTAPVISLRGWIFMAIGFLATICLAILYPSANTKPLPGEAYVSNAVEASASFFSKLHFPALLVSAIGMLALLILMERFFASRKA